MAQQASSDSDAPAQASTIHPAYRLEGDHTLLEVNLREVRQLFHSLDPAPFRQKDLDGDAEEYIVEAVREIGRGRPIRLVFYLPAEAVRSEEARTLPAAVKNYFNYRAVQSGRLLRRVLRRGFRSVLIGGSFMGLCLALEQLVQSRWHGEGGDILAEGLVITGWIGLWRPMEVFLYDWWPIREDQTMYQWITRQDIEVRPR